MASDAEGNVLSSDTDLTFFGSPHLSDRVASMWRDFADRVAWAHFRQDPSWAEIERRGSGTGAREPWFFWVEAGKSVCLTAMGIRRRLPVPGRVFWEFNKGPVFLDTEVLDKWLSWFIPWMGRDAARLRLQPAMPLGQGGDDVETILERQGFGRRRMLGEWATLVMDLDGEEQEVLAGLRRTTRQHIKQSRNLAIEVRPEDTREGRRVIADLQAEMSRERPVAAVDEFSFENISRYWLRGGPGGTILVARHDGEALAAALVVTHRGTAHLSVLPSARRQKELPTSHLLVWEAMCWSKRQGCTTFDMGGYSLTAQPGDSLWGVNQFKRGFASLDQLQKSVAIHEIALSPMLVGMATRIRQIQARRTRRSASQVG